jgi:hypothetical protein
MLSLEIHRLPKENEKQTLGEFNVIGYNFSGKTMELPYLDNQRQISCIPPGVYFVQKDGRRPTGTIFTYWMYQTGT